ncbi:hypothetical protein C8R47DRAFT_1072025 [Mycena vitilis]|nr:hypothetical protein C8R47DRAFT_1072025 [Mycena vitilis]
MKGRESNAVNAPWVACSKSQKRGGAKQKPQQYLRPNEFATVKTLAFLSNLICGVRLGGQLCGSPDSSMEHHGSNSIEEGSRDLEMSDAPIGPSIGVAKRIRRYIFPSTRKPSNEGRRDTVFRRSIRILEWSEEVNANLANPGLVPVLERMIELVTQVPKLRRVQASRYKTPSSNCQPRTEPTCKRRMQSGNEYYTASPGDPGIW